MNINIRNAEIRDYEDLCVIYEELDTYHRTNHPELFIKPEEASRAKEYILELLADEDSALFVAETEAGVVGFAECYVQRSSSFPVIRKRAWVQLDNISVKEEYQHLHIGSMLLNRVKEWAGEKDLDRIELKVYAFNTKAQDFYSGKGFQELNKTMFLNL